MSPQALGAPSISYRQVMVFGAGGYDAWLTKIGAYTVRDIAVTHVKPNKTAVGQGYSL